MGKFSEFKLPLKSMPIGTHEFEYHLGGGFFADMESPDIHNAKLSVKLYVTHKSDVYDLRFDIKGEVTVSCDRCLDEMRQAVNTDYHIVVKYGDIYRDDSDEVLEIPESENYFNVANLIYDTVSLSIPMVHTHREGECNEDMSEMLRQHQAQAVDDTKEGDKEIDPRWAKLKELSENN